nr:hypothetical protein [Tanacetum cinerariifolium]
MSKISQKPGNIGHKIGSLQQKPDQRAFFSRNQAMKPKSQKNQSSGSILANYPKSKSLKKENQSARVEIAKFSKLRRRAISANLGNLSYNRAAKLEGPDLPSEADIEKHSNCCFNKYFCIFLDSSLPPNLDLIASYIYFASAILWDFAKWSFEFSRGSDTTLALIMRTKPGLDTLSFDDLDNNLRVFERGVKGTTASSSNTQNVAFVSTDNTSSTNDVSTAYSVSSPSVSKSQKEGSSSYIDEVIHSFFANQSSAFQLDYDDLEQINDDDMEEMDLKWSVAMISMRIKKFYKRTGRKLQFDTKDPVGFDKTKVECFNCNKMGYFSRDYIAKENQDNRRRDNVYNGNKAANDRRPAYQDDSKALVTIDGEDID